ncbi:MAG: hypothetical protein M9894_35230 [Planctomycetes bacterium]|nr:hypothetical protein [Planctomycetota bacterium]
MLLEGGFVVLAWAGLAGALAWCARPPGGAWPVTGALLLGPEEEEARDAPDLRFRAFAAGVLLIVCLALAFPGAARGASLVQVAVVLAVALPLVTVSLTAAADLAGRALAARGAAPADAGALADLLEEARLEVQAATARVACPHLQAALEALGEALDEYALAARRPGASPDLAARVRGVAALARTCAEAEGQEARRLLGLSPDATPDDAAAVCGALLPLYRGAGALRGVDPARAGALEAALVRLDRRAA